MDFKSPNAFCALAITVFASCAMTFPHRNATQIATAAIFFTTAPPLRQSKRLFRRSQLIPRRIPYHEIRAALTKYVVAGLLRNGELVNLRTSPPLRGGASARSRKAAQHP